MSQRTLAGVLAVPLVIGLWIVALLTPLPYVTYTPGITVDVLGEQGGQPIVQAAGQETYDDEGALLLTTVYVTRPERRVSLFEVMGGWFDPDDAVYPYDAVYSSELTRQEVEEQAAFMMASSQDVATAAALRSLGHEVPQVVRVLGVREGLPADGRLLVDDVLLAVGGQQVDTPQDVVTAVRGAPVDEPLAFRVRRGGREMTVDVAPRDVEGEKLVGITPAEGFDFPFDVSIEVDPAIGGPSAGLFFALAIHDRLTPGPLTGGGTVAGTGSLAADGTVGKIGGIQQKIAASREAGADLFLVPGGNCDDVDGARNGDMRLVRVDNLSDAVTSLESWVSDPDATLPTCERTPGQ